MDPTYSLAGFVVGAIIGMTGVGGGSLMTPLLVLVFGVHPAVAVGTDLLYAAVTKAGGTIAHARRGTVEWRVVALLGAGSVPAAALTLVTSARVFPGGIGGAAALMSLALGVALILTAGALLLRDRLLALASAKPGAPGARATAATVALGVLLGVLVTLSSVGAGAFAATVLLFLYPRMSTIRIVGTDIAHAVPLTFIAGVGHWLYGSVDWLLLGSLLVGSLPGIWLGSHLGVKVPEKVLRVVLAAVLTVVGVKLLLR